MTSTLRIRLIILPAVLIASMTRGASADYSFSLGQDNVIVSGNMTATGGEVSGATVVGGNLNSAYQYAIALPQNSSTAGTNTLIVGGNVTTGQNGLTLDTGQAVYGGTLSGKITENNGTNPPTQNTSLSGLSSSVNTYLTSLSTAYNNMASTNTMANPAYTVTVNGVGGGSLTNQNGTLSFNAVAGTNGVAVVNISASLFNSGTYAGSGQYGLNLIGNVTSIIFNVTGSSATFNTHGFSSNAWASIAPDVLFNFSQATSITNTSNFGYFYGALLAPLATYTNNADNQGSVYVANFNMASEVHLPGSNNTTNTQGYAGYVPTVVPEPASIASMLAGLTIVAGFAWRRRRLAA